ncbi:MAG: tripartite tricarboxylate transporter substrate binding protein [Methylibium sp.]|uniref:Bug family tripartite tricarboxylate transporter substrate binding protein n=1 Tax=Methylibium sp. TaxID=2067992 RepID=UPI0017D1D4D1|nr:tripartite tricarboxylate transporter substrate binding protein [Methylibium sp.]MBA3599547.1 tripartite tricarboxylate transporter substrate binding protein [Methylibium sp.]
MQRRTLVCSLVLSLATAPGLVFAQSLAEGYPSKPVTIIVPFTLGQSGDVLARLLSDGLTRQWGKTVVVENKSGAGGTLGSKAAAGSPADGYTLLLGSSGPMAVAPHFYKKAGYDPRKDFTPIMNVAGVAQVLVVAADSRYKTVQDLIAAAKAAPGKLSYGSGGAGSFQHLTMEMFKQRAAIDIQHVPYKGSAPAYTDLLGGQLDVLFDSQPGVVPLLQAGKVRVLAVSTPQRVPTLPDVPTVAERGYAGFDALGWLGIVAPKGLDPVIRDKLNADLKTVLAADGTKAHLATMGMLPLASSPQEFAKAIDSELSKGGDVIKAGNISLE